MPPQPPIRIEISPIIINRFRLSRWEIWRRRVIGAIFCQVDKIKPVERGIP